MIAMQSQFYANPLSYIM